MKVSIIFFLLLFLQRSSLSIPCEGEATYNISLQFRLSPRAKYSHLQSKRVSLTRLLIIAHDETTNLFKVGESASASLLQITETGNLSALMSKTIPNTDSGINDRVVTLDVPDLSLPSRQIPDEKITGNENHTLFSSAGGIRSPISTNTFTGLSNIRLCDELSGLFYRRRDLPLLEYEIGNEKEMYVVNRSEKLVQYGHIVLLLYKFVKMRPDGSKAVSAFTPVPQATEGEKGEPMGMSGSNEDGDGDRQEQQRRTELYVGVGVGVFVAVTITVGVAVVVARRVLRAAERV